MVFCMSKAATIEGLQLIRLNELPVFHHSNVIRKCNRIVCCCSSTVSSGVVTAAGNSKRVKFKFGTFKRIQKLLDGIVGI